MTPLQQLADELSELEQQGLLRRRRIASPPLGTHPHVDGRAVLAFCSNDYLGLAQHPALVAAAQQALGTHGVGAGAAHLISGHSDLHQRLEEALAAFVGMPAALGFSTGYMANLGVVTALVGRHDAVFADKLNHASLNDAMLLSRAQVQRYPHADLAVLARQLADTPAQRRLIITDSVFSMDGDIAPLAELLQLAERYQAWLLVDDAHGFGVLGPQGRGSLAELGLQSEYLILMATLGKAAGVAGAFVAGAATLIDWLENRARTYVYTTAGPPLLAAAALAALDEIANGDARRQHVQSLIALLHERTRELPWRWLPSRTAIQPLLIGNASAAVALSQRLLQAGIWVPAIRPPTVAMGTARLRVSLSAAHSHADVEQLAATLAQLA